MRENKFISKIIIYLFIALTLTGCTTPITDTYPKIENDFLESDYNQLKDLSENGKLSYDELCQKYVESNLNKDTYKIIDNIKNIGSLSNIKCKKTKDKFTISYDFEDEGNKSTITLTTDTDSYSLKNITFDTSNLKAYIIESLVNTLEEDEDNSSKIYSNITDSDNIENKIYVNSSKYYYLPIENNEIRIYTSLSDIDKSYQSITSYFDKKLEENEKDIKELEDIVEKTEKMYGRP